MQKVNLRVYSKARHIGSAMKVQELAEKSGLTAHTIRFYEKEGLLDSRSAGMPITIATMRKRPSNAWDSSRSSRASAVRSPSSRKSSTTWIHMYVRIEMWWNGFAKRYVRWKTRRGSMIRFLAPSTGCWNTERSWAVASGCTTLARTRTSVDLPTPFERAPPQCTGS